MQGIVFTGGKGPPPDKLRTLLAGLEENALMVAADSGLELAESAGLKPHWIIGDMDSISNPAKLKSYPEDCIIRYPVDKDFTDTELAFSLLKEKGCDDIWIIGGGGGRVDHLFGIRSMLEKEFFPSRWYPDNADIYCLETRSLAPETDVQETENSVLQHGKLSLCLEPGNLVSVFPLGCGPWEASSRGLRWPLDNVSWNRGFFGLSNIAQTGEIMINCVQGRFMVLVVHMFPK